MSNLDNVVAALRKKFGKSYITSASEILDTDYVRYSTGLFSIDKLCGGGIPERKIVMIAGKESSAKTTMGLATIASYQKQGKKCALLNAEFGFPPEWAVALGVDLSSLLIARPLTIEETSDTIEPLIMSGELDLIVLDSIASLSSTKELEESAESKGRSGNAKANGQMVRKIISRLNDPAKKISTSVVLINQIREKQNIMFGNPEYTPGGHALHHACDIIIWLRPDPVSKLIGTKENPLGIGINAYCSKNRTAPPFKNSIFSVMFDGTIDEGAEILNTAVVEGVVAKEGANYTYKDKTASDLKSIIQLLRGEGTFTKSDLKKEIHPQADKLVPFLMEQDLIGNAPASKLIFNCSSKILDTKLAEWGLEEIIKIATTWKEENSKELVAFAEKLSRNDWPLVQKETLIKMKENNKNLSKKVFSAENSLEFEVTK